MTGNSYVLDPKKTALVIIDVQKGYCKAGSDCTQPPLNWDVSAADNVCRAHIDFLTAVRTILPPENIIWTRMEETRSTYANNSPYRESEYFVDLCVRGTEGHDYHLVEPQNGEVEMFKTHPSAFSVYTSIVQPTANEGMDLHTYLQYLGVENVAGTGVIESRCVHSTFNGASERGYNCYALQDLMGAPVKPNRGKASMDEESTVIRQIQYPFLARQSNGAEFIRALKAY
jgi:nicotinamidase-related amidase